MITSRNKRIQSIIESRNGIHLTVYLKFNGDLAQTVLLCGGEVVIAKRSEISKGSPVIAVLKHQMTNLENGSSHTRKRAL